MVAVKTALTPNMSWFQAWWHVWAHPGPQAFRTILKDADVSPKRSLAWLAAAVFLYSLIFTIPKLANGFAALILAVITTFISVLIIAIDAAMFHFVAKWFGGKGSWEKLLYSQAAITIPYMLLLTFLMALQLIITGTTGPFPPLLQIILIDLPPFYSLVLLVSSIVAVENIGMKRAFATVFIPTILVGLPIAMLWVLLLIWAQGAL